MTNAQALLRAVPQLAHERLWPAPMRPEFPEVHLARCTTRRACCTGTRCNNMHALPRTASFTWNRAFEATVEEDTTRRPWVPADHERDIFLLYISSEVPHGDYHVRWKLNSMCRSTYANESLQTTDRVVPGFAWPMLCKLGKFKPHDATLKLRARYCLEPGGDSVGRKSVSDDYAAGCIPVFIGAAMSVPYPEHWRGWHHDAFIILNRSFFLHRNLDIIKALQQVSDAKRLRIERNMASYGQRFMWFEEDVDGIEDSLDVVLRSCWRYSLELGRRK
eukprot:1935906-Amphidinium_carterae.1